jgi:hypothetical protein
MDENQERLLVRVLTRLVQVHEGFGDDCFKTAAHNALVAIARAAHEQAVEMVGLQLGTNVVKLPVQGRNSTAYDQD